MWRKDVIRMTFVATPRRLPVHCRPQTTPATDPSGRRNIQRPSLVVTRVTGNTQENSMKKVYAIVVGLMLLAAPAFAADVDGKWSGTVSTPMGDIPVGYEFKAEGTTLTGTTLGID